MMRFSIVVALAGLSWLGTPVDVPAQVRSEGQQRAEDDSQGQSQAPALAPVQNEGQDSARDRAAAGPGQDKAQDEARDTAQDRLPAGADDQRRYSFHRMGEGFIRLDGRTGQIAQCGWQATGWSCKAVPDERAALDNEISRLQRENAALKKSLLARGLDLPNGVKPDAPAGKGNGSPGQAPDAGSQFPAEAELDRAIAFMKKVWRRLVEMMVDLQRDIQRKS